MALYQKSRTFTNFVVEQPKILYKLRMGKQLYFGITAIDLISKHSIHLTVFFNFRLKIGFKSFAVQWILHGGRMRNQSNQTCRSIHYIGPLGNKEVAESACFYFQYLNFEEKNWDYTNRHIIFHFFNSNKLWYFNRLKYFTQFLTCLYNGCVHQKLAAP